MPGDAQLLLIDADDTLWENNIYFERAIARYMELLAPSGLDRAHIRARINQEERVAIAAMGYGLKSFAEALTRAFAALAPEWLDAAARAAILDLAASIAHEGIEFLPGVEDTLRTLAGRHRLVLMTKGDFAEQTRKVEISGVRALFERVYVVPEKHPAAYRDRLEELDAAPASAWMIGNSPKSDINPALAIGMNAVFVLHPDTWVLEHETLQAPTFAGQRLLALDCFSDLCRHF